MHSKSPGEGAFTLSCGFFLLPDPRLMPLPLYPKGNMLQGNHHFQPIRVNPVQACGPVQALQLQGERRSVGLSVFSVVDVGKLPCLKHGFRIPAKRLLRTSTI